MSLRLTGPYTGNQQYRGTSGAGRYCMTCCRHRPTLGSRRHPRTGQLQCADCSTAEQARKASRTTTEPAAA